MKTQLKKSLLTVLTAATAVALMGVTTPAFAGHRAGAVTISPMLGESFFDNKSKTTDNTKPVLAVGYDFTRHWGIEAIIAQIESTRKDVANTNVNGALFGLDGVYHFNTQSRLQPYLMAGVGVVSMDPGGKINAANPKGSERNTNTAANVGGGLEYFTNPWLALRANAGVFHRFDNSQNHYLLSIGLDFVVGGGGQDKQMPKTAPPAPQSTLLSLSECTNSKTVVNFAVNSSKINQRFDNALGKVAACLQAYPNLTAQVKGYTSNTGSKQHNQSLSVRRAQAVETYLVSKDGVAANRLRSQGFGMTNPLASNNTIVGRAKNRRAIVVALS